MPAWTRRELFRWVTTAGAFGAARSRAWAQRPPFPPLPLRITDVEVHEIVAPYQDYNAKQLFRHQALGFQARSVYVVKTDQGLEGYGETGGGPAPSRARFASLVGRSPFEEYARADHLGMSMALYDLMGKYLGVPLGRLIGPRIRTWVPLCAWTMSQPPEAMAEEARQVSRRGYGWLKFHVDVLQNVVDQTEAVERVAPRGFKLHYDFNFDESLAVVLPTFKELEKFRVAGRIEDPLRGRQPSDVADWRILRAKTALPILAHGAGPEYMLEKAADGCVASRASVPEALRVASLAEAANAPFMLQHVGGNLTLAFLAHQASALRMATVDHVHCTHLWKDDVTIERLAVVGGRVQVPDGPGLGVTLDRDKLRQYTAPTPRPKRDRFLARMRHVNGVTVYFRFPEDPYDTAAGGHPLGELDRFIPASGPPYRKPVVTDFWDETGTAEFERIWPLTASGPYWTGPTGR